ncbi:MAG: hypothetical protein AAFV07_15830, partial [Bacteroidota bacterium]
MKKTWITWFISGCLLFGLAKGGWTQNNSIGVLPAISLNQSLADKWSLNFKWEVRSNKKIGADRTGLQ